MSWKKLKSVKAFETKYFSLSVDECETSTGKIVPKYFVLDFPEWVQVVAMTKNLELVLVDQYRYPGAGNFFEFPGGTTDSNRKEDPLQAAKRELQEETGYSSNDWLLLGVHYPNPALQTNRCHTYLARDCVKTSELNLDPFEELTVKLMPAKDFIAHSRHATSMPSKHHSLMLASLFMALPYIS